MTIPFSVSLQPMQPNVPNLGRDLLNYTGNNQVQGARYIDPITRDFVVQNGFYVGQNATEQQVILAINTTFNSSIQANFGQNFLYNSPLINNAAILQTQITASLNQCLNNLIQNNKIVLGEITIVNNGNGQVQVKFIFTNNSLGTQHNASFNIG